MSHNEILLEKNGLSAIAQQQSKGKYIQKDSFA